MAFTQEQLAGIDGFLQKVAPPEDIPLAKAILFSGEKSNGDPSAESPKGARGLMQLTPSALEDLQKNGFDVDPKTFQYDSPSESLRAGVAYLQLLKQHYKFTNPLHIAAAYNAGPGRVREAVKAGTIAALPDETRQYVKRIAAALPEMQAAAPADAQPAADTQTASAPAPASSPTPTETLDSPYEAPADAPPSTAGAPPPPQQMPPPPTSYPAQIASGLAEGLAGTVDLAGSVLSATGPIKLPSASAAIAPYLAGPPETTGQRYARAAAQGAGALPTGPAAVGYGIAGGLASEAGGDLTERFLGTRAPGEIGGALAVPAAALTKRVVGGALTRGAERKAAQAAVEQAKEQLKTVKDAAALEKLNVQQAATEKVIAARSEADVAVKAATQQADDIVVQADDLAKTVGIRAAEIGDAGAQQVRGLLLQDDPWTRATNLRDIATGNAKAVTTRVNTRWGQFLARRDMAPAGTPVKVTDTKSMAQTLQDAYEVNGMSRDASIAKARQIVGAFEGRDAMPFRAAQTLRSELSTIARSTEGATQRRAIELKKTLDTAMMEALPEGRVNGINERLAFKRLIQLRTAQDTRLATKYARAALDDSPRGRATAQAFLTNILQGKWSPQKQVAVENVRKIVGPQGHEILKDALIRTMQKEATTAQGVQWDTFARSLRDPERYRRLASRLLSPAEQRHLLRIADDAMAAQQEAAVAANRLSRTQLTAKESIARAKEEGTLLVNRARTEKARDLMQVRRQTFDTTRAAKARVEAAEQIAAAQGESVLSQLASIASDVLVGGAVATATGQQAAGGIYLASRAARALRDPKNRAALGRAARLTASSAKGRELLQTFLQLKGDQERR